MSPVTFKPSSKSPLSKPSTGLPTAPVVPSTAAPTTLAPTTSSASSTILYTSIAVACSLVCVCVCVCGICLIRKRRCCGLVSGKHNDYFIVDKTPRFHITTAPKVPQEEEEEKIEFCDLGLPFNSTYYEPTLEFSLSAAAQGTSLPCIHYSRKEGKSNAKETLEELFFRELGSIFSSPFLTSLLRALFGSGGSGVTEQLFSYELKFLFDSKCMLWQFSSLATLPTVRPPSVRPITCLPAAIPSAIFLPAAAARRPSIPCAISLPASRRSFYMDKELVLILYDFHRSKFIIRQGYKQARL
jgi:hypothetical protein